MIGRQKIVAFGECIAIVEQASAADVDVGAAETSKRKISISVQLSGPEDYEGGDLQFYIKRDLITAPKTRGTATLFPSYFLHRVRPVTKGRRRCLILWISGPPFK